MEITSQTGRKTAILNQIVQDSRILQPNASP